MDRRFYVALTALAVFSFGAVACDTYDIWYDDDSYWSDYDYDDYYLYSPAMDVMPQGELAGDFSGFDRNSAAVADVTSYEGMVEVTTIDDRGSAMAQLNIYGDLGTIPAGESRTFHIEDEYTMWTGGNDLYVMGVGCEGATTDYWGDVMWDVDETAEEVTVSVSESTALDGSIVRDYTFTASFPNYYGSSWDVSGYTTLSGNFSARTGGNSLRF